MITKKYKWKTYFEISLVFIYTFDQSIIWGAPVGHALTVLHT